jgi:hypothetical protein
MVIYIEDQSNGVAPERFTPDPDPIFQIILDPENYSIEIEIY